MDFEKLYQTYFMDIYSLCLTMVKNPSLAEELTQECFFRAIKSKDSFQRKCSELTWLRTIAKNLCMDELRTQQKRSEEEIALVNERTPEQEVLTQMTTLHIHLILHKLEEPYKEVFMLRVLSELSFKKIASLFKKNESWARVTYYRARMKIKEELKDEI